MLEYVILADATDDWLRRARDILAGDEREQILLLVGGRVGTQVEAIMREHPDAPNRPLEAVYPRGKGKLSKFKSAKQQRYFFWALRKGSIQLPYWRTGKLVGSLTHQEEVTDDGVKVTVGSNMPYAPLVIGEPRTGGLNDWRPGMQTHYHAKTGWKSLPEQVETNVQMLAEVAVTALTRELKTRLG